MLEPSAASTAPLLKPECCDNGSLTAAVEWNRPVEFLHITFGDFLIRVMLDLDVHIDIYKLGLQHSFYIHAFVARSSNTLYAS